MLFKDVIGQSELKQNLIRMVSESRISHAQLLLAPEGSGGLSLAIAYAQYINCSAKTPIDSCGTCSSCIKYQKLVHPDLHFIYPVATTKEITSKPLSINFIAEWRVAVEQNPYMSLFDWLQYLGVENKQGAIGSEESIEIIKKLSLSTYEAPYKVVIIWMAEKMNTVCANKLLKILEEPTDKTLFLLVVENYDQLLSTITSRTQLIKLNRLKDSDIREELKNKHSVSDEKSAYISNLADGNFNVAYNLLTEEEGVDDFNFSNFQQWMRNCYGRKVQELLVWSELIAGVGRERQKNFLLYCIHMIRESILMNVNAVLPIRLTEKEKQFATNFSKFINPTNGNFIAEQLSNAIADIERNANPKILLSDLSLKIMELLQQQK